MCDSAWTISRWTTTISSLLAPVKIIAIPRNACLRRQRRSLIWVAPRPPAWTTTKYLTCLSRPWVAQEAVSCSGSSKRTRCSRLFCHCRRKLNICLSKMKNCCKIWRRNSNRRPSNKTPSTITMSMCARRRSLSSCARPTPYSSAWYRAARWA